MMRALNFTLFTILLSASFLMAQDCEPSLYYFPFNGIQRSSSECIDATLDNGHIMAVNYRNPDYSYDLIVIKSDLFGNEVWRQTFVRAGNESVSAIKQVQDGGFIVLGTNFRNFLGSIVSNILLFKIDANGELLWTSVLGTDTNQMYTAGDLEVLPDGNFLIVGDFSEDYGMEQSIIMIKTDTNGNVILENTFSPQVQGQGSSVITLSNGSDLFITANGDYIISGLTTTLLGLWPLPNGQITVIKTTPEMNVIWEKVIENDNYNVFNTQGGVESNDGSLYITATSIPSGLIDDTSETRSKLIKLNEEGELQWQQFQATSFTGDILIAPDGDLVLSLGNGLRKLDASGSIVWNSPRWWTNLSPNANVFKYNPQSGGYTQVAVLQNVVALVELDSLGNNCTSSAYGNVYIDSDQDCVKDSSEVWVENAILQVTPDNVFVNTNQNGFFRFQLDTGSYNLQLHPPSALWEVGCPLTTTYDFSFASYYQTLNNLNFGLHALESCSLFNVDVSLPRARVCTEQSISVSYCNDGTISQSGVVIEVELDEILEFQNASIPWVLSGDTYSFDIGELGIGACGQFTITVLVSCDGEIDNTTCVTARILPANDCTLEEGHDQDTDCRALVNSYDPNDKIAIASDTNSCWETALDELAFTVRFQNTGNDTAYRVVIVDTLSSVLDVSTVRPGPSSHPYEFKVSRHNQLMFIFNNINLLDSTSNLAESQGFIQFFIHPKTNIPDGTVIENQAAIYFDSNEPIFTPLVELPQCSEIPLTIVDVEQTAVTECLSDGTLSILAKGGNEVYEFSVNSGENWQESPLFTGLLNGEYNILVRDGAGHEVDYYRNPVVLEKSVPLILDVQKVGPSSCGGANGSIKILAQSQYDIIYSINGGTTFQEERLFEGLSEGVYQILVYNVCMEGETREVVLSDPAFPQINSVNGYDPECGLENGVIYIHATGEYSRSYSFDGGETWGSNSWKSSLPPGDYQIMASYGAGNCEVAYDSLITLVDSGLAPNIQDVITTPISQCEAADASLEVMSTGSLLEYSIDGGITFQQSASFAGLYPGAYTVVVRNDCGISDTLSSVLITDLPSPEFTNVSISTPDCGTANGRISWSTSGGDSLEFTINGWGDALTDTLLTELEEGVYVLNARNEDGCYADSIVVELVATLPPMIHNIVLDVPDCQDTIGSILVMAESEEPLLYSLDMGITWQDTGFFAGLVPGTYSVLVSNTNMTCQDTAVALHLTYTGYPQLTQVNFIPPSSSTASDGILEIFASTLEILLYSIDQGNSWQNSGLFTGLPEGVYYPWVSWQDTSCIVMGDPIELMSPTSTLDFKDENIQSLLLYPNPGREVVKLEVQLQQPAEIKWKITALSGATIKAFGETVNTVHLQEYIPIGQLTAGVYALHVNIDGHNYIRRLVVY